MIYSPSFAPSSAPERIDHRSMQKLAYARSIVSAGKLAIAPGIHNAKEMARALEELEPHIFSALQMEQPMTAWNRVQQQIAFWQQKGTHPAMLQALNQIQQKLESAFHTTH